ncbi:MAG: hypothetical protein AB7Y46_20785 [Armatimonadota bacterium]
MKLRRGRRGADEGRDGRGIARELDEHLRDERRRLGLALGCARADAGRGGR